MAEMDTCLTRLVLLLGAVGFVLPQSTLPASLESGEFCEREVFQPKCNDDEVILIVKAEYGRMRKGRCINKSYGNAKCSLDVLPILDQKCSGRRSCEVIVATMVPENELPCTDELRGYLEVTYQCVKVAYASPQFCQPNSVIELRQPSGYLSSLVTMETNCGSYDSPWWVAAKPGQTLKLTLLDFEGINSFDDSRTCHVYAVIKEESFSRAETVCRSNHREEMVYRSHSNVVEVRLVGGHGDGRNREAAFKSFLIKYEAIGCPDLTPPNHGWIKRANDEVTIGCNKTGSTARWTMKCHGSQWIGSYQNCSDKGSAVLGSTSLGGLNGLSNAHGYSILIIVCIACLVGLAILLFGLIYLRRKRTQSSRQTRSQRTIQHDVQYKPTDYQPHQSNITKSTDNLSSYQSSAENDYYRTWQLQRHQQPHVHAFTQQPVQQIQYYDERTGTGLASYSADSRSRYSEHIYESPNFDRKDFAQPPVKQDGIPVDYFELDPDSPIGHNPGIPSIR